MIACMNLCSVAQAQLQGSIASILNIVITRRGAAPFHNAVLKEPLATGDNIRTGDRSKTSVLFSDKSLLKINALSDIVIRAGINQRDVDISAGRVYGDMKGPGRFRGRYATAAIRGTKLEVEETPTRTIVRCFEGSVVVIPTTAQALAGSVTLGRIPDFQSNSLIGVTDNLIGARVDIVEGTQKGQTRLITNFDPATGTITVNQPYPGPTDTTSRYVIVNPPNTPYVILRAGFETYVSNTVGVPVQPYPTAPLEFLGGDELAWTEDGFAGNQQQHLTGFIHDAFRQRYFELDDERDTSQLYGGLAPSVQRAPTRQVTGGGSGGVDTGVGGQSGGVSTGVGGQTGGAGAGIGGQTGGVSGGVGGQTGGVGGGIGGQTGGIGGGVGGQTGGIGITIGPDRNVFFKPPELGGAAFSTGGSDSALGYARASAVVDRVFVRVSGRVGFLSRHDGTDIDEGLLRYRDHRIGDIQVGRFHWFPGPVSNSELGRLISFTTVDGALWRLPTGGESNIVQLGYFARINSLRGPRVGGYTARWSLPLAQGRYGGSILGSTLRGSGLGYSGDIVYPVLPQKLELYGEAGQDTLAKGFYAVGAYFPQLLNHLKVDASIEYSYHAAWGGSLDMNIHFPLTRQFGGLVTLSKPGARTLLPGVGITATY